MKLTFLSNGKRNLQSSWIKGDEKKMKSTGIIRNIDPLGRIVVPMELRRTLGIAGKGSNGDFRRW